MGDAKSFQVPPHIFRVCLIGDACYKKSWLFNKLANKQNEVGIPPLGRPFYSETVVDKESNSSITLWEISQQDESNIVETIQPFGDAFDVILFTIEAGKLIKEQLEMIENVLTIEGIKDKPLVILVFNEKGTKEDFLLLKTKFKAIFKQNKISKQSKQLILDWDESGDSVKLIAKWINTFLRHKPDYYNKPTWANFKKQLKERGSISLPRFQLNVGDIVNFLKKPSRFFFPLKTVRCLLLALDASGRTTFLYKLKLGEVVTTIPTYGFNVEPVEYKNYEITFWDVGGGCKIRELWKHYYQNTHVVMFFIDGTDRMRLEEAKQELLTVEKDLPEDCAILIVVNKQDVPNVMGVQEVKSFLQKQHRGGDLSLKKQHLAGDLLQKQHLAGDLLQKQHLGGDLLQKQHLAGDLSFKKQTPVWVWDQDKEEGEVRRNVDIMGISGKTGKGVNQALDWIIKNSHT